jgi:hypothetical protein
MVPEIALGKHAVHPPFMMLTQVQVMKVRVTHQVDEGQREDEG